MESQTEFDSLVASVSKQIDTVLSAPIPFLILLVVMMLVIWRVTNRLYEGRVSAKDSLLQLRDAQLQDYKDKLSGATPDAAKARIEALEARLDQITPTVEAIAPRRLSVDQRSAMSQVLDQYRGSHVSIASDAASVEAAQISKGIIAAFASAGWNVQKPMILGLGNPPLSGIGLIVRNLTKLTDREDCVARALKAADLAFDLQEAGARLPIETEPSPIEIILSTRQHD